MLLDMLFIPKDSERDDNFDLLKKDFSSKITFKETTLYLNEEKIEFNYIHLEFGRERRTRLKISTLNDKETRDNADNLDTLKKAIMHGAHRKDYHIVCIYDGASIYYCDKLSKPIATFERKLRQLIYLTVIDAYGEKWPKYTMPEHIFSKLRAANLNDSKQIECGLDELDFQDYIIYLFTARALQDPLTTITNTLSLIESDNATLYQIRSSLNKSLPTTLWNHLFENSLANISRDEIDKIRKYRNIVMHNKTLSRNDFITAKNLLSRTTHKLEINIKTFETEKPTALSTDKNQDHIMQAWQAVLESKQFTALSDLQASIALYSGIKSSYAWRVAKMCALPVNSDFVKLAEKCNQMSNQLQQMLPESVQSNLKQLHDLQDSLKSDDLHNLLRQFQDINPSIFSNLINPEEE